MAKKRTRLVLVCQHCKKRRIKCDKNQPCSNCVKLGNPCIYNHDNLELPYVSSAFRPIVFNQDNKPRPHKNDKRFETNDVENFIIKNGGHGGYDANINFKSSEITPISINESPQDYDYNSIFFTNSTIHKENIAGKVQGGLLKPIRGDKVNKIGKFDDHAALKEIERLKSRVLKLESSSEDPGSKTISILPPITQCVSSGNNILDPPISQNDTFYKIGENPYGSELDTIDLLKFDDTPFSYASYVGNNKYLKLLDQTKHHFKLDYIPYEMDKTLFFSLDEELLLLNEKILITLPPKTIFWKLLDRYFQHISQLFPFIIKSIFMNELKLLLDNNPNNARFEYLNITNKDDYLTISLSLLFIRMASLSLFTNNSFYLNYLLNTENESKLNNNDIALKELVCNPISLKIISVVNSCISLFPLNVNGLNFKLYQVFNYLRVYYKHAPEASCGANASSDTIYSQGFVFELLTMFGFYKKENTYNLPTYQFKLGLRMLIYFLLSEYGNSSLSGRSFSNVTQNKGSLPKFTLSELLINDEIVKDINDDKNNDNANVNTDTNIIYMLECYLVIWNSISKLSEMLNSILREPKNLNLAKFNKILSVCEVELYENLGSLNYNLNKEKQRKLQFIDDKILATRNLLSRFVLSYDLFFACMYNIFAKYYESSNDFLHFFYVKKHLKKFYQILKHFPLLIEHSNYQNDFLINAVLQLILYKLILSLMNFYIKFKLTLEHIKVDRESAIKYNEILVTISFHLRYLLYLLYLFVPNYFVAWKAFRVCYYYYHQLCDGEVIYNYRFETSESLIDFLNPIYSKEQLDEFIHTIDVPIVFHEKSFKFDDLADIDKKWVNFYRCNNSTGADFNLFNEIK